MTKSVTTQCTLICLTSGEIGQLSEAAIVITKMFASTCQLLLVNPVEDALEGSKRAKRASVSNMDLHLVARGKSLGLEATLQRLSFDASLEHMAALEHSDFLIIAQPEHPLERQTLSFTSLSDAAEQARASTLYVPPGQHSQKTGLLCLGPDNGAVMSKLARNIAAGHKLNLRFLDPAQSTSNIRRKILQGARSAQPTLLIVSANWLSAKNISPSRLAASCQTPVLVSSA